LSGLQRPAVGLSGNDAHTRPPKRSATFTPRGQRDRLRPQGLPPSRDRHGNRRDARHAWLGRPEGGRARPPPKGRDGGIFCAMPKRRS